MDYYLKRSALSVSMKERLCPFVKTESWFKNWTNNRKEGSLHNKLFQQN